MKQLDIAGVPPNIPEITKSNVYDEVCGRSGHICAILFVPHILDSGKKGRNEYIETFAKAAKSLRGNPISFGWIEANAQPNLENIFEINQAYPGIAVLAHDKKVYSVLRGSWSLKNIEKFLSGSLNGRLV